MGLDDGGGGGDDEERDGWIDELSPTGLARLEVELASLGSSPPCTLLLSPSASLPSHFSCRLYQHGNLRFANGRKCEREMSTESGETPWRRKSPVRHEDGDVNRDGNNNRDEDGDGGGDGLCGVRLELGDVVGG